MPAPDIILGSGDVLLINGQSTQGIFPIDKNLKFGIVELVYSTCDRFAAGDYVMYDQRDGKQFMFGSTIYILIKDDNLTGQEPIPT